MSCPIDQKKTVLCDLASPLLCVHQRVRKHTWAAVCFGAEGRSSGAVQRHTGEQDWVCAISFFTPQRAERLSSSWNGPADKSYRAKPGTDLALRAIVPVTLVPHSCVHRQPGELQPAPSRGRS